MSKPLLFIGSGGQLARFYSDRGSAAGDLVFQRLPQEQQQALHLIGIEQQCCEEASGVTGCAIGTLKSRVHWARSQLRAPTFGEIRTAA